MKSLACILAFPVLIGIAAPDAYAQTRDCDQGLAACIGRAAAETAVFVEECARTYPDSKADLEAALAQWNLRKLQIPGVEEAMKPDSLERMALRKKVSAYMKSVSSYTREIECVGRMAMLKSKQPKLRADFVSLPADALEPYIK
jgi:hypothetical protein